MFKQLEIEQHILTMNIDWLWKSGPYLMQSVIVTAALVVQFSAIWMSLMTFTLSAIQIILTAKACIIFMKVILDMLEQQPITTKQWVWPNDMDIKQSLYFWKLHLRPPGISDMYQNLYNIEQVQLSWFSKYLKITKHALSSNTFLE